MQYVLSLITLAMIFLRILATEDGFTPRVPARLTFPAKSLVGDRVCVQYLGDAIKEADEIFIVSVTAVNRFDTITGSNEVAVTIEGDGDGMLSIYHSILLTYNPVYC